MTVMDQRGQLLRRRFIRKRGAHAVAKWTGHRCVNGLFSSVYLADNRGRQGQAVWNAVADCRS